MAKGIANPGDHARAVGGRGAGEERLQGPVQFGGVDQAALLQERFEVPDPGGGRRARPGVLSAHRFPPAAGPGPAGRR